MMPRRMVHRRISRREIGSEHREIGKSQNVNLFDEGEEEEEEEKN